LADLSPDSPAKQQGAVIFSRMWQKIAMSFVVQPQLRDNGNAKLDDALANNLLSLHNSSGLRQTF
jgi:hypothetical protein